MNPKRDEWLSHLLSSEPANRPKAESALRDLYAATGLPAPHYLFWFDSLFKNVMAKILLTVVKDSFMRQMVAGLERIAAQRELLVVVREETLRASSQPNWHAFARVTGESLSTGVSLSGPMPAK